MKKVLIIIISIAILAFGYNYALEQKTAIVVKKNDKPEKTSGLYVLSTPRTILFFSTDYKLISKTQLLGGSDLACGEKGKIYVAVRGNPQSVGKEVCVLQDGIIKNRIELTYSMPWIIKYNSLNQRLYIGHTYKITHYKENCITVIDTLKDEEETNIMYDYSVTDMVFSQDNKMIVSAWGTKTGRRLDVFDLKDNSITKTIPMGNIQISSMAISTDGLIYAVTQLSKKPIIYVVDWEKGEIINEITLNHEYPYQVYTRNQDGKEYIYIAHLNYDICKGTAISVIDPIKQQLVCDITNVNCPQSLAFHDQDLVIGDWEKNQLVILDEKYKVRKTIVIERPIDMVFTE